MTQELSRGMVLPDDGLTSIAVSIIIPVFNKCEFTAQCLDRIARHATDDLPYEIIVVDNASTDRTQTVVRDLAERDSRISYLGNTTNLGFSKGNNAGARVAKGKYLLFLNNDTIVQEGWLAAMVDIAESDERVGIVGIKQLFPYTNKIHHTGIIFTADRRPQHIYPHTDASFSYTSKQRAYQAVQGSCLLIARDLFDACGMFDEGYVNGYEDVDLCLTVRARGRSVICCTKAFIYHYGQITETRTADDDKNAARFQSKWGNRIQPDELTYFRQDQREIEAARAAGRAAVAPRRVPDDQLYFGDDLSAAGALTWVTSDLVLALKDLGTPVTIKQSTLPHSTEPARRRALESLMVPTPPVGGVQIRWSHYWPQHLGLDLSGSVNLELFVINYLYQAPGSEPWDYWMQCLAQNRYGKLPLSTFSRDVLIQTGVSPADCHILRPGYSPEVHTVAAPPRRSSAFRFLTVTNSHDLERYGTKLLLEAYWRAFSGRDDVVLVVKDYGASSNDTSLRQLLRENVGRAPIQYLSQFTSKDALIELYKSCDAFVSAHRGEGYGMKILDAMACGLPVIAPLFGGPTDFCTATNALPVDFSLVPVGDCLDTRSLKITNSPVWAEPDVESLASQLQRVARDREAARRIGEQGRREVIDRLTWELAAKEFTSFIGSIEHKHPRAVPPAVAVGGPPAERSPYWMGTRVSVVVPTYNRKDALHKCLRALERQTILPQEFEVLVVDDGSSDGTRAMVEAQHVPYKLTYHHQTNQGPGAARNEGIQLATGELVLIIGDDILADERLLEEHLVSHATRPSPGAAVLGHIDWPPEMERSAVMDFVCGESSLQFAYSFIPKLNTLDFRFFYTSNISAKRQFLLDAAADGIRFDPHFRHAAFEDSEYALRLQKRGLEIHYAAKALAFHEHWMDLDSFSQREFVVGKMAVVFYRKHPQIDDQLQVRWVGDWIDVVDRVANSPELDAKLRALDTDTDQFLRALAHSLESLTGVQAELTSLQGQSAFNPAALTKSLDGVLAVVFDVQRTRGKVEEWYASVHDRERVDIAKRVIGCVRKLEFFSAQPAELEKMRGTLAWLSNDVVWNLRNRVADLERQLGRNGRPGFLRLDRAAWRAARRADSFIQQQLSGRGRLFDQYQSVRGGLKRLLRPSSGHSHG